MKLYPLDSATFLKFSNKPILSGSLCRGAVRSSIPLACRNDQKGVIATPSQSWNLSLSSTKHIQNVGKLNDLAMTCHDVVFLSLPSGNQVHRNGTSRWSSQRTGTSSIPFGDFHDFPAAQWRNSLTKILFSVVKFDDSLGLPQPICLGGPQILLMMSLTSLGFSERCLAIGSWS
jgi:hypothetical protein